MACCLVDDDQDFPAEFMANVDQATRLSPDVQEPTPTRPTPDGSHPCLTLTTHRAQRARRTGHHPPTSPGADLALRTPLSMGRTAYRAGRTSSRLAHRPRRGRRVATTISKPMVDRSPSPSPLRAVTLLTGSSSRGRDAFEQASAYGRRRAPRARSWPTRPTPQGRRPVTALRAVRRCRRGHPGRGPLVRRSTLRQKSQRQQLLDAAAERHSREPGRVQTPQPSRR